MRQIRKIITGLFFLLPVVVAAQSAATKINFLGKWLLVKHIVTDNKKTKDLLTSNEVYTYNFYTNNTYQVSYTNKKNKSTTVYKGKWLIVSSGKKLKLYDNNQVADTAVLVGDRLLPIIRITATEFVTKELLFGMDLPGTSYYTKQ